MHTSIIITAVICLTVIAVIHIAFTAENESERLKYEHEERMKEIEKGVKHENT